jgi:uncharacterized protein (TIGR02285 family)
MPRAVILWVALMIAPFVTLLSPAGLAPAGFASNGLAAEDKPTVVWYYIEYPPAYIDSGPYEGQGFADQTFDHIIKQMPAYHHKKVPANFPRAFEAIRRKPGVCHISLLRTTEREKHVIYSDPIGPTVPNRLLVLKKNVPQFTPYLSSSGAVLLGRMMQSGEFRGGIVSGRFYSKNINSHLTQFADNSKIVKVPYEISAKLLLRGRIDYTFSWLSEAAYLFRQLDDEKPNVSRDTYELLPIAGEPLVRYGLYACSNTAFGRKIIAEVNAIARTETSQAAFHRFYTNWLDKDALAIYGRAMLSVKGSAKR